MFKSIDAISHLSNAIVFNRQSRYDVSSKYRVAKVKFSISGFFSLLLLIISLFRAVPMV